MLRRFHVIHVKIGRKKYYGQRKEGPKYRERVSRECDFLLFFLTTTRVDLFAVMADDRDLWATNSTLHVAAPWWFPTLLVGDLLATNGFSSLVIWSTPVGNLEDGRRGLRTDRGTEFVFV